MNRLWQIIGLILVSCIAAKTLIVVIAPLVPALVVIGVAATVVGSLVQKKRRL